MDQNSSSEEQLRISNDTVVVRLRMAIIQVLVWSFVYIDLFMLFTFFSKQAFRGTARYILFTYTLLMDLLYLLLTDLTVLFYNIYLLFPVGPCILLCIMMEIVSRSSPLTISAMCLERYVAVCMPLRHAVIATPGRTLTVLFSITAYCSLGSLMHLVITIITSMPGYFAKVAFCHFDVMILTEWHGFMRAVWYQVEFGVIVIIILFCYIQITLAARSASGENKQSASKGKRTLLLHSLQLFLCLVDMFSPYTEKIMLEHSLEDYLTVRYFNFVAFGIVSRGLSSIIYGFRDKKFSLAIMYYITCKYTHNTAA